MHEVARAEGYEDRLQGMSVIVEPMKRWQRIWDQLGAVCEDEQAKPVDVESWREA